MLSVEGFYDGLADDYDLVWGGCWEAVMDEQGAVLDQIIRGRSESAVDVLDCAWGSERRRSGSRDAAIAF